MAKVGKRTTEQAVLEAMVKVEKPVTVAYLERTVGMHYSTAIKVLDEMIKEKLVKKIDTTGVSFYVLPKWTAIDC
jgi:predicted transcriptional regulator